MTKKVITDKKSGFFDESIKATSSTKKHLLLPIALIILGISVVIAVFSFIKYQEAVKGERANSQVNQSDEIARFVKEVGEFVDLPKDETPTLATVSDVSKLSSQPFFKNAQNGDIVLVYDKAKKAILYRPSAKKVIDITTININASLTPTVSASPSAAVNKIKVVILNGTKESGLARKASALITGDTIEVVSTGNTSEDYQTTSISSISISNSITENQLKEIVKDITKVTSKVTAFPIAETKPANVDVVIILGEDFAEQY